MQKNGLTLVVDNQEINLLQFVPNKPTCLQELESHLQFIHNLTVCNGGPSIEKYSNVYSECAFKDKGFWRHKKCPRVFIEPKKFPICSYCSNVGKRLWMAEKRQIQNSQKGD